MQFPYASEFGMSRAPNKQYFGRSFVICSLRVFFSFADSKIENDWCRCNLARIDILRVNTHFLHSLRSFVIMRARSILCSHSFKPKLKLQRIKNFEWGRETTKTNRKIHDRKLENCFCASASDAGWWCTVRPPSVSLHFGRYLRCILKWTGKKKGRRI